jgi:hypothetical protein
MPGPRKKTTGAGEIPTKKSRILELARETGHSRFTAAEIDEICRRTAVSLGKGARTSSEYVASVLKEAGLHVGWSALPETEERYEEEFKELLHFADLQEAEMCLIRIDELMRKFEASGERAAAERVLEIARLGRRRAEMISHNHKVDAVKREQKAEIARWFAIWLETPDAFFDWLEVRKRSPEFQEKFAGSDAADQI